MKTATGDFTLESGNDIVFSVVATDTTDSGSDIGVVDIVAEEADTMLVGMTDDGLWRHQHQVFLEVEDMEDIDCSNKKHKKRSHEDDLGTKSVGTCGSIRFNC